MAAPGPWIGGGLLLLLAVGIAGARGVQERGHGAMRVEQAAAADAPAPVAGPGTYRVQFTHDGLQRHYIVHVPKRLAADRPPVLLALHGGGGSMDYQARSYGLIEKSEQSGFVVVFPNGFSRFPRGMLATWNAGRCCGQARDRNVDDVGFLGEVIRQVQLQTGADPDRLFVTGMSNGAMMAYRLACELPGRIRGIAAVAGTDNTASCETRTPVPLIHFHARDDTHVLFTGGAGKDAFRRRETVTDFTSVPATIARWVAINRAAPTARRVLTAPGATCDLHAAGAGGAKVQLCVTESGGHSWPGAPGRRGKEPSTAISANDLMWDFFASL